MASLHRWLTGLHPVDICFLKSCFRAFFAVLIPCFLNVSQGAEYSKKFFLCVCLLNIALPINNLHVAICRLGKYAMNLDNSIGAEDKMLVTIRTIEIYNICYLSLCMNVKVSDKNE